MKKSSLKEKIWLYLAIFSLVIVGGILTLQILSLDIYYEWNKSLEIKNIAKKVLNAYEELNYDEILDMIAFREDVCISIQAENVTIYSTDNLNRGCSINSTEAKKYNEEFILSNKHHR